MSDFKTVLQPAVVQCSRPLADAKAHKCEFNFNIGIFFDGTDNNQYFHKDKNTNTNVVRLSEAYRQAPDEAYFRHYVSGVGSPFSEIEKTETEAFGGAAGAGGEARILYGLLQVINSVHGFINSKKQRFNKKQLAALCSTTQVPTGSDLAHQQYRLSPEQKILDDLGLTRGLVDGEDRQLFGQVFEGERGRFFTDEAAKLRQQLMARETRPVIAAIYLDVFGFSRGAAQARVFVNWLYELMLFGGKLFGVPSHVRMLGLFDTVASVGVTSAIGSAGHNAWATGHNLRIHPEVKNCVHYVALHELRTNFPLDSVRQNDVLPPNCQEYQCPGAHSDVGGGYAPGEQGKGVRLERIDPRYPEGGIRAVPDDQLKLANLPLNRMYAAALGSCRGHVDIPWIGLRTEEGIQAHLPERFGLDGLEKVKAAVSTYFEKSGVPADQKTVKDALREHGLRYLAWRYKVNKDFEQLPSVNWARSLDREGVGYYLDGQKIFKGQIALLEKPPGVIAWESDKDAFKGFNPHASDIFKDMKKMSGKLDSELGRFFDEWVQDSYAGFIAKFMPETPSTWAKVTGNLTHIMAENQRYVRWRELYAGDETGLNAQLSPGAGGGGANQTRAA